MNHVITPTPDKKQINISSNFFEIIFQDMGAILVTKKMDKWYNLSYAEFCHELSRMKVCPSTVTHRNWETFFAEQKQQYNELATGPVSLDNYSKNISQSELALS